MKLKDPKNYENEKWVSQNTCHICRQRYKNALNWEAPECEQFWICRRCVGFSRFKIEAHENGYEECKNSQKSEKNDELVK